MALTTALAVASVAATAAGTVASYSAQKQQTEIAQKQIRAQSQGAKIEAARQRRQAYRDMLRAQAASEVSAAAGGATEGSGLAGGLAQAANSNKQTQTGINTELATNLNMARMQGAMLDARQNEADGRFITSIGESLGSFNKTLVNSAPELKRVTGSSLDWLYGSSTPR